MSFLMLLKFERSSSNNWFLNVPFRAFFCKLPILPNQFSHIRSIPYTDYVIQHNLPSKQAEIQVDSAENREDHQLQKNKSLEERYEKILLLHICKQLILEMIYFSNYERNNKN